MSKDGKELIEENVKDVGLNVSRGGNCACIHCGAEANSKCPHCRTIFPTNQMEAMLSYGFKRHIKKDEREVNWLKVEFFIGNGTEKDNLEFALTELYTCLAKMAEPEHPYPSIAEYACDHIYHFKEGEKSSISCGHSWKMYKKGGE